MKFQFKDRVKNDCYGLSQLGELEQKSRDLLFDTLKLDFTQTRWFDAQLSAVLGAILTRVEKNGNDIKFDFGFQTEVEKILKRNGFLEAFQGQSRIEDTYGTTIEYEKFRVQEVKKFRDYLEKKLFNKEGLSETEPDLKKRILKSLIEVFKNPGFHAECEFVFSCGQYYYKGSSVKFCIANLGKTIYDNVSHYFKENNLKKDINSLESIEWSLQKGNTTREGIPGGFGLPILKEFLQEHQGKLIIYSENGFWSNKRPPQETQHIKGTVVSLEFKI